MHFAILCLASLVMCVLYKCVFMLSVTTWLLYEFTGIWYMMNEVCYSMLYDKWYLLQYVVWSAVVCWSWQKCICVDSSFSEICQWLYERCVLVICLANDWLFLVNDFLLSKDNTCIYLPAHTDTHTNFTNMHRHRCLNMHMETCAYKYHCLLNILKCNKILLVASVVTIFNEFIW